MGWTFIVLYFNASKKFLSHTEGTNYRVFKSVLAKRRHENAPNALIREAEMPEWDYIGVTEFDIVFDYKCILDRFYLSLPLVFPSNFKCIITNSEI